MKNKKKNNFHYKKYVLLTFIMVLISFSPNHSQKVFISGENNYNDENIANKQLDYLKPHNTGLISTHEMSARIESIAIWDDVAYVCDYDGYLNVVNISNPTEMEDITRRRIDSIFFNIQIDGNRVYVVHTFGMNIYDISDKWNPVLLVDLWSLNNGFHDIDIQNEIAYVTNRSSLICYDVSDPSSISKIRELDLHVESNGITVADNIAYITASNYLLCIDVEDPYNPQYLANHTLEYDELGIEIEDKYLYVSDWANGLKIFDVSNPSAPYLIGEVDTIGYIQNIDIIDGFVYAAAGEGGLICIDVQDPYNPYVARYFKTISEFKTIVEVNDVDVCGGLIYVAERDYGLMVYRLEKYIENKGFSTYNTNIRAETVVIQDELAFVTNYTNGFQIINISDPQSPLFVSFYAGTIYDVDVEGNTVYTSGSVAISSINVDDPRNPIGIGNYDSSPATYSNSITVHNNIAYVAYYEKIYSFDVSNPSNPIFLDTITVAGSYDDSMIKIHGDIAYILCNNRLNAINITNPSALSLISTKWNSLDISDFTIFDDIAFLAADDDGIICLNISDPAAMVELSRFDFYGEYSVKSLEVKDQIIYLGCSSELVLFDCTDIYSMEYLIEYAIPDTAMGMSISGNLIAIACDRGGLYLIELETHVNNQIPTPYLKKIIPDDQNYGIVNLDWDTGYLIENYTIFRDNYYFDALDGNQIKLDTVFSSEYLDTIVDQGDYYYAVIASNENGNSSLSNCESIFFGPPPAPIPEFITETHTDLDGNIQLEWSTSIFSDNYTLFRYNLPITRINGSLTEIGPIFDGTYVDLSLGEGIYYYAVIASNGSGNSRLSENIVITVDLPSAPTPFFSTTNHTDFDGNIDLDWSEDIFPEYYTLYRYNTHINSINDSLTSIGPIFTPYYQDLGLDEGTYYYAVTATNSTGTSELSENIKVIVDIPYPSSPELNDISPFENSDGIIELSWDDDIYVDRYYVYKYWANIISFNTSLSFVDEVTESNAIDIIISDGTYYYIVIASNDTGNSTISNCVSVSVDLPGPDDPRNIVITPNPSNNGHFTLSWESDPNAQNYTIYRSTTEITSIGLDVEELGFVEISEYNDFILIEGSYYYAIVAHNHNGDSNLICSGEILIDFPGPSQPILNPITSPNVNGEVDLNWNEIDFADYYIIYRYSSIITTINENVSEIGTSDISSFLDTDLDEGTYYYVIIAVNDTGFSNPSNCEHVEVDLPSPDAPSLLKIRPEIDGDGSIQLDWNDISYRDYYVIYRYSSQITSPLPSDIEEVTQVTESHYIDENLKEGTYYYVIVAVNENGISEISNCESVIVKIEGGGIASYPLIYFSIQFCIVIAILIMKKKKHKSI